MFVARRVASRWRDCRCGRSLLVVLDAKLVVHQKMVVGDAGGHVVVLLDEE